jgi:3-oxoacyl-[acyl-carrier-protein] synthase-1
MLVTALGMMTSVGWDALTACAAIRAGVSRPKPVDDWSLDSIATTLEVFPTGHPVAGYTDGFVMLGRWSRLFDGALQSLWTTSQTPGPEDAGFWKRTALVVVLPRLTDVRFGTEEEDGEGLAAFADHAARTFLRRVGVQSCNVVASGRVGLVPALRFAREQLRERSADRVIVAAVDSYLDPMTLDWLAASRRLKHEEQPAGLSPGEAGACLLIESEGAARERSASAVLHICGMAEGADPSIYDDDPNLGLGLASAVRQSLDEARIDHAFSGDLISDLNGETWRATAYGIARSRLTSQLSDGVREIFPAQSIGDVGAATSAVALCVAGRSFARGYAMSQQTLVLNSTECGQSVALLVSAPRS